MEKKHITRHIFKIFLALLLICSISSSIYKPVSAWIARINAAARMNDISYSKLMHGLKLANIDVNRKMLADLAISDAAAFTALVDEAKKALAK